MRISSLGAKRELFSHQQIFNENHFTPHSQAGQLEEHALHAAAGTRPTLKTTLRRMWETLWPLTPGPLFFPRRPEEDLPSAASCIHELEVSYGPPRDARRMRTPIYQGPLACTLRVCVGNRAALLTSCEKEQRQLCRILLAVWE